VLNFLREEHCRWTLQGRAAELLTRPYLLVNLVVELVSRRVHVGCHRRRCGTRGRRRVVRSSRQRAVVTRWRPGFDVVICWRQNVRNLPQMFWRKSGTWLVARRVRAAINNATDSPRISSN